MKVLVRLLFLASAIALGFWTWNILFTNPKTAIRNRLKQLGDLASYSGHEGNISTITSIEKLGRFFTENAKVVVDIPGGESHTFDNRDELMQAALAARSGVNNAQVKFLDPNIEMDSGGQSALVDVTLQVKIDSDAEAIVQELKFTIKKIKGAWLITHVETVKTLKL
jgi:hypothetical protein